MSGNNAQYHHGELRKRLVTEGIALLEEQGEEQLSIRELARRLGVSKTAPYRHFPNREALLGAISNEGFRILFQRLEALADSGEIPGNIGMIYFTFIREHPLLYRLMFSPLMCRLSDEDSYWARKTLEVMGRVFAAGSRGAAGNSEDVLKTWAYLHGLASIYMDNLYPDYLPEPDWKRLFSKEI